MTLTCFGLDRPLDLCDLPLANPLGGKNERSGIETGTTVA